MKYYMKEIPDSALILSGAALRFDILETEDSHLIAELDKCIERQVGGILSITKQQYEEELKKKETGRLSGNSSNPLRRRQELSANLLAGVGVAAEAGRSNGQFAAPQLPNGREATPHNRSGLPKGNGPAPDPIDVPSAETFIRPPTSKANGRPRRALARD